MPSASLLKPSVGTTSDIPTDAIDLPASRLENANADALLNAADASLLAFVTAPAIAVPIFDAPCSCTWKPAPNATAPNISADAVITVFASFILYLLLS